MEIDVISNIDIILSSILDIVYFQKITQVKLDLKHKGFLLLIILIVGEVINESTSGALSTFLADMFVLLGLLFLYKNRLNINLLVGSLITVYFLDLMLDYINSIIADLSSSLSVQDFSTIVLITIEYYLIFKYHSFFRKQLTNKNKKVFIFLLTYLYIIGITIAIILGKSKVVPPIYKFLAGTLLIQAVFAIVIYILLIKTQKNILNKQQQEKLQEELLQQKRYAETLEKEEDSLRRFRHDYKNMLTAVKYSVKNGNYDEAIVELDRYSEENLDKNALLKYKDVNHIKDEYVKSLLITKISKMANANIKYNFECRKDIPSLSEDIEILDLIRILGIAIDNAIEESEKILAASNKNDTDIQIMMNTAEDVKLEFEIRNKILTDDVSLAQMKKRGYTTKKGHDGVGLANIEQIKQKYPAMDISYSIEDGYFDFYMVIEEDGDYDEDNYL